jgi:hypothetical protein
MNKNMNSEQGEFNWGLYKYGYNGVNLTINPTVVAERGSKVYCQEPYAKSDYDKYYSDNTNVEFAKDALSNSIHKVINMYSLSYSSDHIGIDTAGGNSFVIDLNKEKPFLALYEFATPEEFIENVINSLYFPVENWCEKENVVVKIIGDDRASLWEGHISKVEKEFAEELHNPTRVYTAHIKEINNGGYIVDVCGSKCFLPGSLAATNKLVDYSVLLGKDIKVMIINYIPKIGYYVSHKKYLQNIIPEKIKTLKPGQAIDGVVTGTSKYGIFVEFDEIFTGMIHISNMSDEFKRMFDYGDFKPQSKWRFWIQEITEENRIILREDSNLPVVEDKPKLVDVES